MNTAFNYRVIFSPDYFLLSSKGFDVIMVFMIFRRDVPSQRYGSRTGLGDRDLLVNQKRNSSCQCLAERVLFLLCAVLFLAVPPLWRCGKEGCVCGMGRTHLCGERGCLPERLRTLQGGGTALHFAAKAGHTEVVEMLVGASGADIEAQCVGTTTQVRRAGR